MKKLALRALFFCGLFLVVTYILFQVSKSPTFQFFGTIVSRVATEERIVALTFDDGPSRQEIDALLTTLRKYDVPATFFLVGEQMEAFPEGASRLVEAGHELGNHSYTHPRMILKSPSFVRGEIEQTDRLIRRAGIEGEIPFRPPYGKKLFVLPWYLRRSGRVSVTWDVAPDSTQEIASKHRLIAKNALQRARPGSIILLHPWYESREETRRAIPLIIEGLQTRGFRLVTVSELLSRSTPR